MPFVMGQCPECGKILPFDDGQKTWICGYCEAKFPVSLAIDKFNTLINIKSDSKIDDFKIAKCDSKVENTEKNVRVANDISDFKIKDNVIIKYKGSSLNVIIPDGIRSIGNHAFKKSKIVSVDFPDSLIHIRSGAFCDCTSLKSVVIPESVIVIESGSFWGCESLNSVQIPDGVKSIEKNTFSRCILLNSITFSENLNHIGDYAFSGCYSLKSLTIPKSVKYIGKDAFWHCMYLKYVKVPKSADIADDAFEDCPNVEIEYY